MTSAAANNVSYAQGLQSAGFQPYKGQQVANFSPQQQASFGMGTSVGNAVMPTLGTAGSTLTDVMNNAGNVPQVGANSISSQMSPYMNQYVSMALQPQLQAAANAYMLQNQAMQGAATSAGAFGDPRAAMLQGNLGLNYALENQGLVGNAYNAAFNTAIGAGAQDVANNLNAQQFNVSSGLQGLNTQLGAANSALGAGVTATNLVNALGGQQTAQSQAQLNAKYNQWLMRQQYPFQTTGLVNSTIGAAQGVTPINVNGTTQLTQPNNAGYGLIGAGVGALGSALSGGGTAAVMSALPALGLLSDPKVKENKQKVGKLHDGTPVYSFNFKADPTKTKQIGLMSTDVKKKTPEAVHKIGGIDHVDYGMATRKAAQIGQRHGLKYGLAA